MTHQMKALKDLFLGNKSYPKDAMIEVESGQALKLAAKGVAAFTSPAATEALEYLDPSEFDPAKRVAVFEKAVSNLSK